MKPKRFKTPSIKELEKMFRKESYDVSRRTEIPTEGELEEIWKLSSDISKIPEREDTDYLPERDIPSSSELFLWYINSGMINPNRELGLLDKMILDEIPYDLAILIEENPNLLRTARVKEGPSDGSLYSMCIADPCLEITSLDYFLFWRNPELFLKYFSIKCENSNDLRLADKFFNPIRYSKFKSLDKEIIKNSNAD